MAILRLNRKNEFLNRFRKFKILLNGNIIGEISNNEVKDFDIPTGNHTLSAKVDWCFSPEIPIEINDNNKAKQFTIGGFKNNNWIIKLAFIFIIINIVVSNFIDNDFIFYILLFPFFILIYYFTFGRKSYLTIEEI